MAATKVIKAASSVTLSDTAKNTLVFTGVAIAGYLLYKTVTLVSDVTSVVTDPLKNINKGVTDAMDVVKDNYQQQKALAEKQVKEVEAFKKTTAFQMAFTPSYWQGKTKEIVFISNDNAMSFAKSIRAGLDVFKFTDDDFSKIQAVYRNTPSKASMMKVGVYYFSLYKSDLWTDLGVKLSNAQILAIRDVILTKKDFTKKSS